MPEPPKELYATVSFTAEDFAAMKRETQERKARILRDALRLVREGGLSRRRALRYARLGHPGPWVLSLRQEIRQATVDMRNARFRDVHPRA